MNTKSIVFALLCLCNAKSSFSAPWQCNDFSILPVHSFSVFRNPALPALERQPVAYISLKSLFALQALQHRRICVLWPLKQNGLDVSYESLGNSIAESRSFGIGLSRRLNPTFSFGCKAIYEEFSIDAYGKSAAFGLNAGLSARISKQVSTAFSVCGLFKPQSFAYFNGYSDPAFQWGFLYHAEQKMKVTAEIEKVRSQRSELKFGLIYTYDSAFAFSAFLSKQFKEPGFGVHYHKKQLGMALSCRIHVLLGISYQIILSYALKS